MLDTSTHFPYTTLFRSRARPPCRRAGGAAPRPRRGRAARRRARALHDAGDEPRLGLARGARGRSEEHTSELQSRPQLVCRLLFEKKKKSKLLQLRVPTS